MTPYVLFSSYLHDQMNEKRISKDHLIHELGYRTSIPVTRWLEGRGRPMIDELPALSTVLRADPVEVVLGWVIDQVPELETVLRAEVLDPHGSKFPRSTDLALRMPKPQKWVEF